MTHEIDQALQASERDFAQAVESIKNQLIADGEPRQKWTQEEAIAFECACDCITDMIAIQTRQIAEEANKAELDVDRIESLRTERSRLFKERLALHVGDIAEIERIRHEYGACIRIYRGTNPV
jgi:hypothetical protein